MKLLLLFVIGYLLGSWNGAVVVSKQVLHDDIRDHGSGNAGLTNFFRTFGGILSFVVIAIDAGKTIVACLLARIWVGTDLAVLLTGIGVIMGHSYPLYEHFKGGKGILCGASVVCMLDWRIFLLLLAVFGITVALTRYVSLGSVLAAISFAVASAIRFRQDWIVAVLAIAIGVFVIIRHRSNIKRLLTHTENKLTFRKSA